MHVPSDRVRAILLVVAISSTVVFTGSGLLFNAANVQISGLIAPSTNGPLFGIITSEQKPSARNFYWLFGNQSVDYNVIPPSAVDELEDIDFFNCLVVWTDKGDYNAAIVSEYARTHIVIADMEDFSCLLYPTLETSLRIITADTIVYNTNWGNFQNGDVVNIRNETGKNNQLRAMNTAELFGFKNLTTIAKFDTNNSAILHMEGNIEDSGFYVMDLDATTSETEWTGIWHILPAMEKVQNLQIGKYARWMANGHSWHDLAWINDRIDNLTSQNYPIALKTVIGTSVQGRQITAIRIGTGTKIAIIDGAIHGNEKTGTFACLRVAELLIDYYKTDPYWQTKLREYTFIIIPVLNPDGFVLNTRTNANKVNLNRQFPPDGETTESEAWALRNLMVTHPPTIYISIHEGYIWYPLDMIYGAYEPSTIRDLTVDALKTANDTFSALGHYGRFTAQGLDIQIGKVDTILPGGGEPGMSSDYASYQYKASSLILETFVWSQTEGPQKSLWALDYYPAIVLSFITNLQR